MHLLLGMSLIISTHNEVIVLLTWLNRDRVTPTVAAAGTDDVDDDGHW